MTVRPHHSDHLGRLPNALGGFTLFWVSRRLLRSRVKPCDKHEQLIQATVAHCISAYLSSAVSWDARNIFGGKTAGVADGGGVSADVYSPRLLGAASLPNAWRLFRNAG